MTIETVSGWDATHSNLPHAPKSGQAAGYATGSSDIVWTSADFAAHPGVVVIDQDAGASDDTADVLDVENGAATPGECPGWVTRARASIKAGKRKGQREPAIYVNQSNIHLVATALANAGITDVGIWLADYNLSMGQASAMIASSGGPYPIVAVQYSDQGGGGFYDEDVFSKNWLDGGSSGPPPTGPFRQVVPVGNLASLDRIIADRNGNFDNTITLSLAHLDALHAAVLTAYVALDKACVAAPGTERPVAPGGLVYYTVNP